MLRISVAWKVNLIVIGGLVLLLGSSILFSLIQSGTQIEARIRLALTGAVASAAEVVDPAFASALTVEQVAQKEYQGKNEALKRLTASFGLSDIYVLRQKGEGWVFVFDTKDGPFNDDKTDFIDYKEPPPEVNAASKSDEPQVTNEPYTDEWGTFRSAFRNFPGSGGKLVLGADFDIAQLIAARRTEVVFSVALGVGGVLLAVLLAILLGRLVGRPLRQVSGRFSLLTGVTADLTQRIEVRGTDELAELGKGFNGFVEKLGLLVTALQSGVAETSQIQTLLQTRSGETAATVERAGLGLAGLNASGTRLESTMGLILRHAEEIVHQVGSLESLVKNQEGAADRAATDHGALDKAALELRAEADEVGRALDVLDKESAENARRMDESLTVLKQLQGAVDAVNGITAALGDTAQTTGLLAMNASIEAAHAGAEGRGFAVIADTMRKLADSSKVEADRIGQTLADMLALIARAAAAVEETALGTRTAQEGLDHAAEQVRRLTAAAEGLEDYTRRSRAAVDSLREDWAGVARASEAVSTGTRTIFATVREAGEVSETIRSETESLLEDTDRFAQVAGDIRSVADRLTAVSRVLEDNMLRFKTA
jgi:methyl-accepting chemotaxis protein